MKAGVCQWVFNRMLVDGEMNMMDCVEFVGKQTDAECFEGAEYLELYDRRFPGRLASKGAL